VPARGASEAVDDVYALAKAQFDLKEFLRAAHTLRVRFARQRCGAGALSAPRPRAWQDAVGSKARFLRCYALYLAGEKRKTEELVEVAGPMVRRAAQRFGRARLSHQRARAGPLQ